LKYGCETGVVAWRNVVEIHILGHKPIPIQSETMGGAQQSALKNEFCRCSDRTSSSGTTNLQNYLTLLLCFPSANMSVIAMEI
jgi:hypothetical protein